MKLSKVIDLLATGELLKVNLGDNTTAGITQYNHKELVNHINLGLLNIYTRLPIRLREVTIEEVEGISYYNLNKAYAETNTESTEPVKYIKDTADNKFDDSYLSIDNIYDEFGHELLFNDRKSGQGYIKTAFDQLFSIKPVAGRKFIVAYRAKADELDNTGLTMLEQEVYLPQGLLQALLYYVAYRVHTSRNTLESVTESAKFLGLFEKELVTVSDLNIGLSPTIVNEKLTQNGWV